MSAAASPDPQVSVLVAARNAAPVIGALLEALDRQTLAQESREVIIVDDCSQDCTGSIVAERPSVRLLRAKAPRGAYAARNLALEEARGKVIAITDADCEPSSTWLERGLEDLDAGGFDLLGGRIDVPLHQRPRLVELVDASHNLDQRRFVGRGFAAFANFFCRRAALDRIGTFNEDLISNGDREFCLRAVDAGFRLGYSDRSVVLHPPRKRAADLAGRCFRMGIGRAQTVRIGGGPARERRRNWLRPADYRPASVSGLDFYPTRRLRDCGFEPSRLDLLRIDLASYALLGIPLLAGYATGALAPRLPGRIRRAGAATS